MASLYPNPFRESVSIALLLTKSGSAEISVYNLKGQRVRSIVTPNLPAGKNLFTWDEKDAR
ncbi:MAG: T9SS type A sorting domain-containing protein [Candidatus Cloacimonadaceae bacterium]|nr:T9SS type A sorting domain-containing protein [Candidatus Cloacimonadaceae bacterium]